MQRLLIKIVGETHDTEARTMGGLSGISYTFHWTPYVNEGQGAYCYAPKTQVEVDDILAVNRLPRFPWQFSVCMADITEEQLRAAPGMMPLGQPTVIPPYVAPERYESYPPEDLVDLARNCGFVPVGDLTVPDNIKRQLHAYFVGRAWAIEEVKKVRAENLKMKQEVEAARKLPAAAEALRPSKPIPKATRAAVIPPPAPRRKATPAEMAECV